MLGSLKFKLFVYSNNYYTLDMKLIIFIKFETIFFFNLQFNNY